MRTQLSQAFFNHDCDPYDLCALAVCGQDDARRDNKIRDESLHQAKNRSR